MQAKPSIPSPVSSAAHKLRGWYSGIVTWLDNSSLCPLFRQAGVTAEQWNQLAALIAEYSRASDALRLEVERRRTEIYDLLAAPEVDPSAIAAKQQEILEGRRRLQNLCIQEFLAEKRLLTPDQQKACLDLLRYRSAEI